MHCINRAVAEQKFVAPLQWGGWRGGISRCHDQCGVEDIKIKMGGVDRVCWEIAVISIALANRTDTQI
jgi:hypothetical protein